MAKGDPERTARREKVRQVVARLRDRCKRLPYEPEARQWQEDADDIEALLKEVADDG